MSATTVEMAAVVQIAAYCFAALADLRARIIPELACVVLGLAGAAGALAHGPVFILQSCGVAMALLLIMLPLHARGVIGGGDVKLLAAASVGLPLAGVINLMVATALAGGFLAIVYLSLRWLPPPALAPAGASTLRRFYAVERWRIRRGGKLPYGIAIACGGIVTTLAGSMG